MVITWAPKDGERQEMVIFAKELISASNVYGFAGGEKLNKPFSDPAKRVQKPF